MLYSSVLSLSRDSRRSREPAEVVVKEEKKEATPADWYKSLREPTPTKDSPGGVIRPSLRN
jgi:hypothetical protein